MKHHFLVLLAVLLLHTRSLAKDVAQTVLESGPASSDLDLLTEERLKERWNKFMMERTRPMEFNNSITSPNEIHTARDKSLFLSCGFNRELTGRLRISFMRIQDLNLLAVGKKLHSADPRIEIINSPEAPTIWTLKLNRMRASDSGLYECQLNTQGPKTLRRIFNVTVIVARMRIEPPENVTYLNVGSHLKLSCFVESGPLKPQYMLWYRNDQIIQYSEDVQARVVTELASHRNHHRSDMIIENVHEEDSGEYRCSSDLTDQEAKIAVYVVREDSKSLHVGSGSQPDPLGNHDRGSQTGLIIGASSSKCRGLSHVLICLTLALKTLFLAS